MKKEWEGGPLTVDTLYAIQKRYVHDGRLGSEDSRRLLREVWRLREELENASRRSVRSRKGVARRSVTSASSG